MFKLILICLICFSNFNLYSKDDHPTPKFPKRHIRFQAGQMGQKPWDPQASYSVKISFNSAVFTQLLYFDQSYNILPGIIKTWHWDYDKNSYIFEINTNLVFDKTRKLKVEDVIFAILKRFITNRNETNRVFFEDIVGTETLRKGEKFDPKMCNGIKIISDTKFSIELKNPNPTFLYRLGSLTPPVAPIEDFDKDLLSFKVIPRGTGPYKVTWSDIKSSRVFLERKHLDPKTIQTTKYPLSIDFYNHGEPLENIIDLAVAAGTKGTKDNPNFTQEMGKIPDGIQVLDFNYNNKYGKSILFRKAVSLSLNRTEILKSYGDAIPSHEMIPSQYYGRANKKFIYDPEKAKAILQKHFPELLKKDFFLDAIFHGTKTNNELPKYLQVIKNQLFKVGLKTKFNVREWTVFKKTDTNLFFSIFGLSTSFVDPLAPFANYMPGSTFENHTDVNDDEAYKLYKMASKAQTIESRAATLSKLSSHFHEQYRHLPLEELYPIFAYNNKILSIGVKNIFYTVDFNKVVMSLK